MELEIITPKEVVAQENQIDDVKIPAEWGQMQILPGHADYMTKLVAGALSYTKAGQSFSQNVSGGLCTISKQKITILVDDVLASVSSLKEAREKKVRS